MRRVWRVGLAVVFLGMLVVIPGGPAAAVTCSIGSTCTYDLQNSNTQELNDANVDVRVIWDNSGANGTIFSVQYISGAPAGHTPIRIVEFAFNFDTTGRTISITGGGTQSQWTTKHDVQVDSFGNFATDLSRPAGTFGITAPILFTVSGDKITDISPNASPNNALFVTHLVYDHSCSGFVSDGSPTATKSEPGCAPVPEPGTLMLVGSGLVGLGAVLRKRFRGKGQEIA